MSRLEAALTHARSLVARLERMQAGEECEGDGSDGLGEAEEIMRLLLEVD